MSRKRPLETIGDVPYKPASAADATPSLPEVGHISNKHKRAEVLQRYRRRYNAERKKERLRAEAERERARAAGEPEPERKVPRTIENTRVPDETMVARDDVETMQDEAVDELSTYFAGKQPKILLTTNQRPSKHILQFVWWELKPIFPGSQAFKRKKFALRDILRFAENRGYTDVIVANEDFKRPSGLLLIHLPDGPTAYFRLTSLRTRKMMGRGAAKRSGHNPELILNNFNTRLGHSVGRMFASLFPQTPQFMARRVVTLHNQRDFIFFRQHRYVFEENKNREKHNGEPIICNLQEIGPRFTLKLQYLQAGVFDGDRGDFEYIRKREESRRKFYL